MLNILFALYYDFRANSAIHVHSFANQLARFGHNVAVAVPKRKETAEGLGEQLYSAANFPEVDGSWSKLFANGQPPDVVHAWTPRENVRLFCEKLRRICRFNLFIHMEDNEEIIVEANLRTQFSKVAEISEIPPYLSHPLRYRQFLGEASGITIIIDRLEKFVPPGMPRLVLWPGADSRLFYPQPKDDALLTRLRIPINSTILCYTGNVHALNAREVRSLYLAAAMLNREGTPTTLVRAGRDYYPFLGSDEQWARKYSVELGYVKHTDIPRVLSLADVLIQPGKDSAFNEYRLPSKLPEFFAMGRPVILPHTNVGRFVKNGKDAWVLPKVDAMNIVKTLQHFRAQESLLQRLCEGARQFYEEHFDWEMSTRKLEQFYNQVLHRKLEANAAHYLSAVKIAASAPSGSLRVAK